MRPILILGASGFVGYTIYKELARYFNTYGTYNSSKDYVKNKQMRVIPQFTKLVIDD